MTLQEQDAMKWLIDALDHLKQYETYSTHMRQDGKGFKPIGPFSPDYLRAGIKTAIQNTLMGKTNFTLREKHILENA